MPNHNKGRVVPEQDKKKISKTLKERYKNQEHHAKGKEPWNKGLIGEQEAWNKGKEMEKIECPHCQKMVDKGNAKRWHFDNCKLKSSTNPISTI